MIMGKLDRNLDGLIDRDEWVSQLNELFRFMNSTEERQALGFYEDLKKKEERLLGAREALHAKLPSAGERTLLLPFQQHQALRHLRSGLWVRLGIMQLCWKGKRQAAAQCQG